MSNKHIHFIGICGVAMSALALAFKKAGYKVTGSDVGFYPPVSTHLKEAGVEYYPGWHPEKMIEHGVPNLVVVGNVASSRNPEWRYVQDQKIPYQSYPEVVRDFFVKQNSIVCAGTYGKTTSTALLAWIFKHAGHDPSYMFGGVVASGSEGSNEKMPSAELTKSQWSILEGDEYKTARWDTRPKFYYYTPTHLLLTSVVWDHADVYPTEHSYIEAFQNLFNSVPQTGVRVLSEKAVPMLRRGSAPVITYGKTAGCDYLYGNVEQLVSGVNFTIFYKDKTFKLTVPLLGEYMADNATGCFAVAREIGIEPEKIISAIATFPGLRRRLEKRFENNITIFDDIAHSPTKAQAVLESLRRLYTGKIYAVFEPNSGNRERAALPRFSHAFASADEVIIPHLTKLKHGANATPPVEGDELASIIKQTHPGVVHIAEDSELVTYIKQKIQPGDVVVFLGSHGFRGMIENLIEKLTEYA
jgi:UDP-N-acetylmuramate: L-alanyl-gamma-D-glutamyl-meso-diaminopimelate ligase